jgi:uncharacterized membrane protein YeaQ/YmgE (transglycosylase-associated protein family)
MSILAAIIVGGFAGWLASMVAGTNREQGIVGNIVVGVLGAILGSLIAGALGIGTFTGFNISSFLIALAGAVVLLFIYKAVRGGTAHSPTLHR